MKKELINTQAELVACERKLAAAEQERDQARQAVATLRRQVEVLCRKLTSFAMLPNDTSSGLSPVQAWREWAEQQAKEAK